MRHWQMRGLVGLVVMALLAPAAWADSLTTKTPQKVIVQQTPTGDGDTGGAMQTVTLFGIALPASGGAVFGGTSTNPLRTDPTGTTTQPVSLASVPSHAVTNAGTFATQIDGAALTALQLIDNIVNTIGSTTSGSSGVLGLCATTTSAPTYTTGQNHPCSLQTDGSLRVYLTGSANGANSVDDDGSIPAGTTANTQVVSLPQMYNGSAWIRMSGDATNGLDVDVTRIQGTVTVTATNLDVQSGGADLATEATLANMLSSANFAAAFGTAGSADSQVMSIQGIASMTPVQVQSNSANLATQTTLASILTAVELIDNDQTGASLHHRISVGTTEDEHEVKGSAGRLFAINVTNTNAAVRYLRCANQVIGSTTPGTTTVFYGMAIPAATTGAGYTTSFGPKGIAFSTGLTCWLVTGAAETDVAEVAANEINVNYVYE